MKLSHLDDKGNAHMVDVGAKPVQRRSAVAQGTLHCAAKTINHLQDKTLPKGDALAVARIAAIQAAKKTSDLIPLCHSLPLDQVTIEFALLEHSIEIKAAVRTSAKTGVEMEALTAVSIAALTLYDMLKAVDHSMQIGNIGLLEKVKE